MTGVITKVQRDAALMSLSRHPCESAELQVKLWQDLGEPIHPSTVLFLLNELIQDGLVEADSPYYRLTSHGKSYVALLGVRSHGQSQWTT